MTDYVSALLAICESHRGRKLPDHLLVELAAIAVDDEQPAYARSEAQRLLTQETAR